MAPTSNRDECQQGSLASSSRLPYQPACGLTTALHCSIGTKITCITAMIILKMS